MMDDAGFSVSSVERGNLNAKKTLINIHSEEIRRLRLRRFPLSGNLHTPSARSADPPSSSPLAKRGGSERRKMNVQRPGEHTEDRMEKLVGRSK